MAERKRRSQQFKDQAIRVAGLLSVTLLGVLVIICGLTLSLGFHRLSMISFFGVLALLVFIRIFISVIKNR
jgi:hypothetical protein